MRLAGLSPAALAAAATLSAALCAASGCGPSALQKAYDGYKAKVEPLLDREAAIWKRHAEISSRRDERLDLPEYYVFLEKEARPFYDGLRKTVEALDPGHPGLAAAHDELVVFARSRLEYVVLEQGTRDVKTDVLEEIRALMERAEAAKEDYVRTVIDVPDPRFTTLQSLVKGFERDWLGGLQQGRVEPRDAEDQLRRRVLPQLRELRDSRYEDDPGSQALRKAVATAEEYYRKLADGLPVVVQVSRAAGSSFQAAKDADEHLERFKSELAKVRRSL